MRLNAILSDRLGTPVRVAEAEDIAESRWARSARPFGATEALVLTHPSADLALRFPGQREDPLTGLHYNYFRDYDPALGRYTTPDPLGLAGGDVNLYAYVDGDPVNFYDPDGLGRIGARRGATIGAIILGTLAAAGAGGACTLVLPGVGTFGCGEVGLSSGVLTGTIIGGIIGSDIEDICTIMGVNSPSIDCDAQAEKDEEMCRQFTAPGSGARARCWESVQERYGACVTGKPLPPLVTE